MYDTWVGNTTSTTTINNNNDLTSSRIPRSGPTKRSLDPPNINLQLAGKIEATLSNLELLMDLHLNASEEEVNGNMGERAPLLCCCAHSKQHSKQYFIRM